MVMLKQEDGMGGGDRGAEAGLPRRKRYDFEFPDGIHISDLLAIQLAECARLVRNLTDNASQPHLMDVECLRMVDQLKDIVGASTQLTREIGRLQNGTRYEDDDFGTHA